MEIPERIEKISLKPGTAWTPREIRAMKQWLSDRAQVQTIWYYATRYLGTGATQQDIEDAVVDFYTLIDQARMAYRPGGPSFCHFLIHVCFRNNCLRDGSRVRKRIHHETALEYETDDQVLAIQIKDTSAQSDPGRLAQSTAFTRDLNEFLNTRQLPDNQKTVFVLRYLEGMSYEGIAETVGSPIGSIKGWLSRATITARTYLEERGWSECHVHE